MLETAVLMVGGGPAGSSSALLLSTYGIPNILVAQRTMEILRDMELEDEAMRLAAPQELMANAVICTRLAGEELGRIKAWGNHPRRKADYTLASPTQICDIPQDLLEPI